MDTTAAGIGVSTIGRREAARLAAEENRRILTLLLSLDDRDWSKPTDCPAWDVRALAGHVLAGMEADVSVREFVHQFRAGSRAKGDGRFIDGLTAVGVRERAHLSRDELLQRLTEAAPRAARARARTPWLVRQIPIRAELDGAKETWRLGYVLDVIETRDTWMHRVDLARATDRELVLTAEHDGRIVADVVADWARRHGRPFTLSLQGPAGGRYAAGEADEALELDAVEFCRTVSGRGSGSGLLSHEVPF